MIFPKTFRLPAGAVLAGFNAPSIVSHTLPSTPSSGGSPSILKSSADSRSSPFTGSSRSVQKTVARHCKNEKGSSCTSQVVSLSLRLRAWSGNVTLTMRSPSLMYDPNVCVTSSSAMVSVMLLLDFQSLRTSLTTRTGAPREDRAPTEAGAEDAATWARPPRKAERRAEALVDAAHLAAVAIGRDKDGVTCDPPYRWHKLVAHIKSTRLLVMQSLRTGHPSD